MDKVDCVGEGKDICSKHGVSGYPTLKVFRNGAMEKDYDGPREASKSIKCLKYLHVSSKLNINELTIDHFSN